MRANIRRALRACAMAAISMLLLLGAKCTPPSSIPLYSTSNFHGKVKSFEIPTAPWLGVVQFQLFIPNAQECKTIVPLQKICLRGDDRTFNLYSNAKDGRASIELNFFSGVGKLYVTDTYGKACTKPTWIIDYWVCSPWIGKGAFELQVTRGYTPTGPLGANIRNLLLYRYQYPIRVYGSYDINMYLYLKATASYDTWQDMPSIDYEFRVYSINHKVRVSTGRHDEFPSVQIHAWDFYGKYIWGHHRWPPKGQSAETGLKKFNLTW